MGGGAPLGPEPHKPYEKHPKVILEDAINDKTQASLAVHGVRGATAYIQVIQGCDHKHVCTTVLFDIEHRYSYTYRTCMHPGCMRYRLASAGCLTRNLMRAVTS